MDEGFKLRICQKACELIREKMFSEVFLKYHFDLALDGLKSGNVKDIQKMSDAREAIIYYLTNPVWKFSYKNHRGIEEERSVYPKIISRRSTPYYPEGGWVLDAFCYDRKAMRGFYLPNLTLTVDSFKWWSDKSL